MIVSTSTPTTPMPSTRTPSEADVQTQLPTTGPPSSTPSISSGTGIKTKQPTMVPSNTGSDISTNPPMNLPTLNPSHFPINDISEQPSEQYSVNPTFSTGTP